MAQHGYVFQGKGNTANPDNIAKAVGRDLNISMKTAVEVCRFVRGKSIERAKKELQGVIDGDVAVPYMRYNKDVPHRTAIGPGKYPRNVASTILGLLESATSNAQSKGLSTGKLAIIHICALKASAPMHGGRNGGRKMKRAHVEVVVAEVKPKEKSQGKKRERNQGNKVKEDKENKGDAQNMHGKETRKEK